MDTIYDGLRKDKVWDTTKFTLYFKLLSIYWRYEPEVLADGISHMASAYKNGKLSEKFIDRDVPGTPQADISWVRCCHYFIKLGLLRSSILQMKSEKTSLRFIVNQSFQQKKQNEMKLLT